MKRRGFSLLEVILALAILGGAVAVLGEASRLASRNAAAARDMARAQLLCETKMAQIVAGIIPPTTTSQTAFDPAAEQLDSNAPGWFYAIDIGETDELGLIAVRITVTQNLPAVQSPVRFVLVRWMPDPNAASSVQSSATPQASGTSATGGSGG